MLASFRQWILPAIITVFALADGVLHRSLDFVLFRGRLFGSPGPPPGGGLPGGPPGGPLGAPAANATAAATASAIAGAAPRAAGVPAGPPPGQPALPLPLNELFLLN